MDREEKLIIGVILLIGIAFGLIAYFWVTPTLPKPNVESSVTQLIYSR